MRKDAMSEYQYYEFCSLHAPLTADARKEMQALSSRTKTSTHGAAYLYNYGGSFRGNIKKLLLKYFDVFFYISNFGSLQLIFKYTKKDIDENELQKYCVKHLIQCETTPNSVLLDIHFTNEEGFGWVEGEGMLSDLLPLYNEIKAKNYQFLNLMANVHQKLNGGNSSEHKPCLILSPAQQAFLEFAGID